MSDALVGFLGILVGAAITTATNMLLEERRFKRTQAENADLGARQELRAARLVEHELVEASYMICMAIDYCRWWTVPEHLLPSKRWLEFAPDLASSDRLAGGNWTAIAMTYEHIDEINAELSWAMRRGGLPEIDEQRDVQLRIQLNSIDDSLQALQEITHNDSRGFSPDPVCTVVTAGERAARQLGPPTHVDQSWITEEIAYRVTSELKAVGVAVMGAPRWERFDLTLETDTLVRAGKVATGMSVFVGIVIGEKAERNRYVPIPLANSKKFDGFATLIAFEHAANRLVPTEE